jgi:hypothetical protein
VIPARTTLALLLATSVLWGETRWAHRACVGRGPAGSRWVARLVETIRRVSRRVHRRVARVRRDTPARPGARTHRRVDMLLTPGLLALPPPPAPGV